MGASFRDNLFVFSNKVHVWLDYQWGVITCNCPELEERERMGQWWREWAHVCQGSLIVRLQGGQRIHVLVSGWENENSLGQLELLEITPWRKRRCFWDWVTQGQQVTSHSLEWRSSERLPPRTKAGSSLRSPVGLPVVGLLGFRVSLFPQTSEATDLCLGK